MKVYYGFECPDQKCLQTIKIFDCDDDLIITEDDKKIPEKISTDIIPLLNIHPQKISLLFDDYGFFSQNGKCYVYLDMICLFSILAGRDPEKAMFLLQVEEELIALEGEQEQIFILCKHNEPLIKKWAAAYEIDIEFILL